MSEPQYLEYQSKNGTDGDEHRGSCEAFLPSPLSSSLSFIPMSSIHLNSARILGRNHSSCQRQRLWFGRKARWNLFWSKLWLANGEDNSVLPSNSCLGVYCVPNLFENDTNAKEIDANAVATFRVKFDHVAMDNFHAVFTRRAEPGGSPVERRPCRDSSASSFSPTILSKSTSVRLCWLSRDPTAMRTLLRARTTEQQRSVAAAATGRSRRRAGPCGAAMGGPAVPHRDLLARDI